MSALPPNEVWKKSSCLIKINLTKLLIRDILDPMPYIYDTKTIQEAKKLWEKGVSYQRIAKKLHLKRAQTPADWKKRFGWSRPPKLIRPASVSLQTKLVWEEVRIIALKYLRSGKGSFKSSEGAILALREAEKYLLVSETEKEDTSKNLESASERVLKIIS